MHHEDLGSLRKKLLKIGREEIVACLRTGSTDLETVAVRVEARAEWLIEKLWRGMARADLRRMLSGLLKRTEVKPEDEAEVSRQLEFSEMEEFRGIPYNVTYYDKPNHCSYTCYLDTLTAERDLALALLAKSILADQQTYLLLKAGNEFAASLVAIYGDLPLWDLYTRYKADQQRKAK